MPTKIFGIDSYGDGTQATLADGVDVFVRVGVLVGTSTDAPAILGKGSNHSAVVMGDVAGNSFALVLGGNTLTSHDNRASIRAEASVTSMNTTAVLMAGYHCRVSNAGFIQGLDGVSFNSSAEDTSTVSTLKNSGVIEASGSGVVASGEALRLYNSGTIEGEDQSFYDVGAETNSKVFNSGMMVGRIFLGGGDDLYDGRKGHVDGVVEGSLGKDRIYGGTDDDTLSGGEDADTLTGGKGDDAFVFDTVLDAAKNVDAITDFSPGADLISLENQVFKTLNAGALPNSAFRLIGDGASGRPDTSDRILYDKANGDLYFDQDGSRSQHKAVLFAHVDANTELSAADFIVV